MDEDLEKLGECFGGFVRKPDDMPLDDFFNIMREANRPPLDLQCVKDRWPYINGTIWDRFHDRRILTYLGGQDGDDWMLLAFGRHRAGGGVCMLNAQHWMDGRCVFSTEELPARLKEQDWRCIGLWAGIEYPEIVPGTENPLL